MPTTEDHCSRSLLTVRQWCAKYPFLTEGGVRHLIFHRVKNGFDSVVLRIGKKVLLDESKFFEWLDQQNLKT